MTEHLMKPSEVAERFRVTVSTVRGWIRDGDLPAANIGTENRATWRIKESDVEDFARFSRQGKLPE